ncbi:chromate transporter [Flavobacterium cauense R2A-7]|uniref:Chromate transporter n=1 Tax=Flavobacterium cauense R2A-7 TaxID=1341154 RepID=V6S109_9FLAO|nr:chromate efflux transporter [Flavobacterium cauense]ESU19952.1 chromate transporter [Flavobacterium cauense R2A-7]KGO83758.1 chromate transporter [Flavobacterium cauense R2A-7]TWI12376.1 chromate transporter [Flavobacterium cauense R2A-7]
MQQGTLTAIGKLFLKLGLIAFGGPAAHIAMMRDEVVRKHNWMSDSHFLDLVGATNLIPGPNSTELAIHLGKEKGGWKGLLVAGLCFILPAVFITLFFAWLYKAYGTLPEIQPFIYGIKPAIIAIILSAVYPLAKSSLKSNLLIGIGILALIVSFFGVNEVIVLFGCGLLALAIHYFQNSKTEIKSLSPMGFLTVTNTKLFFIFLKIGSILYGSGYVLFAFLDSELVQTGILPRQTLIDAIAVGQFTPGPVFSSVTFIGYQINGGIGVLVATIGIFLPSFVFVAMLNPLVRKMRSSKLLASFLDAVNVASVALIIVVCFTMGKDSVTEWKTVLIAVLSLIITFGFRKINSVWVVLGGSLLGYLLSLL